MGGSKGKVGIHQISIPEKRIHLDVSREYDPFDLSLIHKPYSDLLMQVNLAFFI